MVDENEPMAIQRDKDKKKHTLNDSTSFCKGLKIDNFSLEYLEWVHTKTNH